jgi:hypothetical protein
MTKKDNTSLTSEDFPKRLYSRKETAKIMGFSSPGILAMWAFRKRPNLPYIKVGKLIRYLEEDILKFLVEHRINNKTDE